MKMKKWLTASLSAALCVSLLAGCGDSSGSKDIIVNLMTEPSDLNSVTSTGSIDGNVLRHCMEGLVTLDENDEAIPGVAKSWEVSDDKLTYTFKLRDDSVWSNGDKVTAKDFEFAYTTLFSRYTAADYADTWAALIVGANELLAATEENGTNDAAKAAYDARGWKAIDDTTFEVKLTAPTTYFIPLQAFINFYPVNEKFYNEQGKTYATEYDKLLYNGPFTMTSWEHEGSLVLERNEDYWDDEKVKLEKITMEMISDTNAILNKFNAGEIDMVGLTGEQADQVSEEDTEVLKYDDGSNFYLEFNTKLKGLNNAKVRKALTVALDAEGFIKNILKNTSKVANSFTPAAISNGEFTKEVGDLMKRDTVDAKALLAEGLAEEGMTVEDLKITMLADEGDSVTTMCAYVQEQFKKVGVTLEVEQITYKARLQRMTEKDFDIVFAGWGPDYNDPMTFLDLWITDGGNNHTSWSNAEYDAAISAARVEGDVAKRTALLVKAEQILAAEMPVGYVYCRVRDYVCSDRLTGVRRTAFQDLNLNYAEVK